MMVVLLPETGKQVIEKRRAEWEGSPSWGVESEYNQGEDQKV